MQHELRPSSPGRERGFLICTRFGLLLGLRYLIESLHRRDPSFETLPPRGRPLRGSRRFADSWPCWVWGCLGSILWLGCRLMCKNFGCGVQGAETIIATIYNLSVMKLCDVSRFSFMIVWPGRTAGTTNAIRYHCNVYKLSSGL